MYVCRVCECVCRVCVYVCVSSNDFLVASAFQIASRYKTYYTIVVCVYVCMCVSGVCVCVCMYVCMCV